MTKKNKLIKANIEFLAIGIFTILITGFFLSCSQLDRKFSSNEPNFLQTQEKSRVSEQQIPGTNPLELLKLEQLQQELGLTNEQIAQLKQSNAEITSKLTYLPENRPASLRNSQLRTQEENGRGKVAKILNPEQLNRFKQISLQIYGWELMPKEEVTEILAITPEQEQKLQGFREPNKQKISNSLQEFKSENPQECQKVLVNNYRQLIQASQEINQQFLSILNQDQVETLEYMLGEKFELNLKEIPAICP